MEKTHQSKSLLDVVQDFLQETYDKKMKEHDIVDPLGWGWWAIPFTIIFLLFGRVFALVFSVIIVSCIYLFVAVGYVLELFFWLISWLPKRILRIFSKS